jgi:hypothetical protein
MYCVKYSCKLSEQACRTRQTNNSKDLGCRDCETGRGVMARYQQARGRLQEIEERLEAKGQRTKDKRTEGKKIEVKEQPCRKCGLVKQITTEFYKNPKLKTGYDSTCKKCRYETQKKREKEKRARQKVLRESQADASDSGEAGGEAAPTAGEPDPVPKNGNVGTRLTIDLAEYPELMEKIVQIAKDELRTPEMQVLYWLKKNVARLQP